MRWKRSTGSDKWPAAEPGTRNRDQAQRYQWRSIHHGSGHLKNEADRKSHDDHARDHQHSINSADVFAGSHVLVGGYGMGGLAHGILQMFRTRPVRLHSSGLVSVVPTRKKNRCFPGNRVIHSSLAASLKSAREALSRHRSSEQLFIEPAYSRAGRNTLCPPMSCMMDRARRFGRARLDRWIGLPRGPTA